MVVVSDLLDMFVRDPQFEANEATYPINEIVNSITRSKSKALEDVLVVGSSPYRNRSSNHNNIKPCISYNKMIRTRFDKSMKINAKENNMIDIKISAMAKRPKMQPVIFTMANCFQLRDLIMQVQNQSNFYQN